jgi:S1-C subfamily serine protease
MLRSITLPLLFLFAGLSGCATTTQVSSPPADIVGSKVSLPALIDRVRPSLVVVRYTFDGEMGRRDLEGAGIVVDDMGLVAFTDQLVPPIIAHSQAIDFRIVLPPGPGRTDEIELKATYLGIDARSEVAFVRVNEPHTWTPLKPVNAPIVAGDVVHGIGLLTKSAGYAVYGATAQVSAVLRGPTRMALCLSGLPVPGSPVFNGAGEFVGIVPVHEGHSPVLNPDQNEMASIQTPPVLFVPISNFLPSLQDPPTALDSRRVPWLGIAQMTGLKKEVADYYAAPGVAAIQLGDVVPKMPAALAGLRGGDVIVSVDGKPLERGDTPEELPVILSKSLSQKSVGDVVEFGVVRKKGSDAEPIRVTLGERPAQAASATRHYAEDLGFSVRDLVFEDRYARRVDAEYAGVLVPFVKPQSSAAAGGLRRGDVITKVNQTEVVGVDKFKTDYADVRQQKPAEAVVLEVLRGSDTQIIRIQPPQ